MDEDVVSNHQEPSAVPTEVLLYKMTRQVKTENTVVLS